MGRNVWVGMCELPRGAGKGEAPPEPRAPAFATSRHQRFASGSGGTSLPSHRRCGLRCGAWPKPTRPFGRRTLARPGRQDSRPIERDSLAYIRRTKCLKWRLKVKSDRTHFKSDSMSQGTYTDAKGRTRWHENDALGDKLKELYNFLVIGNYEESHAARYPRLAHTISRHDESVITMKKDARLTDIPGVSKIIEKIITELLETGTCAKMDEGDEYFTPPPRTVLELTKIPRLGAKTARTLYQKHGIDSLATLSDALEDGTLSSVRGLGQGMLTTIKKHVDANL